MEIALAKDLIEASDGLVDLAVTLLGRTAQSGFVRAEHSHIARTIDMIMGACAALNLPFKPLWDEVIRSNLSKTADSEETAKQTVVEYQKRGIEAGYHRSRNGKYIIICTKDSLDETGSPIIQGKLLKSIDYSPADIAGVLEKYRR
ncbi:nucleoside triphosphate pyrophosphohydrolase family protein [Vibrio sp. PNB22_3_1]